ncbi:GIY-YIG nuclease family protein [Chloroflexus aggregans]
MKTVRKNFMSNYNFYIYILTNWNNKVMYIGITNNLERRIYEHKNKMVDGFTKNITLINWSTMNTRPRGNC